MAITSSAAGATVLTYIPWVVTKNKVTFTLDGSTKIKAEAGTAHGGPTGATPDFVLFMREGGTSADASFNGNVTNYDTTNDEIDWTLQLNNAAGTNTNTIIVSVIAFFFEQATGGISA